MRATRTDRCNYGSSRLRRLVHLPDRERCIREAIDVLIADANSDPGLRQLVLLQTGLGASG